MARAQRDEEKEAPVPRQDEVLEDAVDPALGHRMAEYDFPDV
ncbi:MAG: hypothetical protein ABGY32_05835 [bacterium]